MLRIATNEIASFCIDNRLRQMAFFVFAKVAKGPAKAGFQVMKLMLKDFEIKGAFSSLLYKTNRFHVAVRLFGNRSQKTSKCGEDISDTLGSRLVCHFFVLSPF